MNGLFFSRVFLKARLFSVLYFRQIGDFTKAEKTDELPDTEGKRKDHIETSSRSLAIWRLRVKQTWSSSERWGMDFRLMNYGCVCSHKGSVNKWCDPGGMSKVETEGSREETPSKSSIWRKGHPSKAGGEETLWLVVGEASKYPGKEAESKV